jgi:hypothetical protein
MHNVNIKGSLENNSLLHQSLFVKVIWRIHEGTNKRKLHICIAPPHFIGKMHKIDIEQNTKRLS